MSNAIASFNLSSTMEILSCGFLVCFLFFNINIIIPFIKGAFFHFHLQKMYLHKLYCLSFFLRKKKKKKRERERERKRRRKIKIKNKKKETKQPLT
jgi:hypothetical protein